MEIYRGLKEHQTKVYESEWFVDEPNHKFAPIELTDAQLCNCDPAMVITFKFIRRNQFLMTNTEVCSTTTSLQAMEMHNAFSPLSLRDASGKEVATLLMEVRVSEVPRFTDFMVNGFHLNMIGAIDFTFSNGHQDSPLSLHYLDSQGNSYINCIKAVMTVLH